MTTRHVSAENDYPFQGVLSDTFQATTLVTGCCGFVSEDLPYNSNDVEAVSGILDLYFIIQGTPTRVETAGSSSSSSLLGCPEQPFIYLSSLVVHDSALEHIDGKQPDKVWEGGGTDGRDPAHSATPHLHDGQYTDFVFTACDGSNVWEIKFRVPNESTTTTARIDGPEPWADQVVRDDTGAELGQIYNDDDTSCHAVLIFNSDKITTAGGGEEAGDPAHMRIPVEPGRAQWHVEQVDDLNFFNIDRCNGVENEDSSWPVVLEEQSSSSDTDIVVDWVDGYNCELEASSGSLELVVAAGIGEGTSPDYGDTGESCTSLDANVLDDSVLVINGVPPINGDIPLSTSPKIVIQRTRGLIELVMK